MATITTTVIFSASAGAIALCVSDFSSSGNILGSRIFGSNIDPNTVIASILDANNSTVYALNDVSSGSNTIQFSGVNWTGTYSLDSYIGSVITGTGIADNTYITSYDSSSTFTISNPTISDISGGSSLTINTQIQIILSIPTLGTIDYGTIVTINISGSSIGSSILPLTNNSSNVQPPKYYVAANTVSTVTSTRFGTTITPASGIGAIATNLVASGRNAVHHFAFCPKVGQSVSFNGVSGLVTDVLPNSTFPNAQNGVVVTDSYGNQIAIYFTDRHGVNITAQDVARNGYPTNQVVAVTYADWENDLNDMRSRIRVVNPSYIRAFVQQYREVLNA
jgi:hypothetical protein